MKNRKLSKVENLFLYLLSASLHNISISDITLLPEEWEVVLTLAKAQNVFPLVFEKVSESDDFIDLPEYEQSMMEAMTIVAGQVRRTESFLALYNSLIEKNVHPIVMKGIICRQLYNEYCDHRPSGDEDILILKSEFGKIQKILIENGYIPERSNITEAELDDLQEISFYGKENGLVIEVHINPMGYDNSLRSKMNDYFVDVFDNSITVEVKGIPITTMSTTEHFLYLILHAFRHLTAGGIGIRQIMDILLYEQKEYGSIDWGYVRKALNEVHAEQFLNDIIYIGNQYLGFDLPMISKENCPMELLEDLLLCGVFGNETKEQIAAGFLLKGVSGEKTSHFMMIVKAIFPSKRVMTSRYPEIREKPWLLPVRWMQRWGRVIRRTRSDEGKYVSESMKISKRRIELLKKYDVL